ncbi:hypothetical protein ACLOJK_003739 [Asimina triloba]
MAGDFADSDDGVGFWPVVMAVRLKKTMWETSFSICSGEMDFVTGDMRHVDLARPTGSFLGDADLMGFLKFWMARLTDSVRRRRLCSRNAVAVLMVESDLPSGGHRRSAVRRLPWLPVGKMIWCSGGAP